MVVSLAPDRSPGALEGLHRGVLEDVRALRAAQVGLGEKLLALRRAEGFYPFGTTTFPLYCEKVGLSAQEGRELATLAEASEVRPAVAEEVSAGRLSLQKSLVVAEFLLRPGLQRAGEDWLQRAGSTSAGDLRDLLKERKEALQLGEPPVSLHLWVSRKGRDCFQRCREVASRAAGAMLTEGMAFEVVCEDFLQRHDPMREARRLEEKDRAEASRKGTAPPDGDGARDGDGASRRRAVFASTVRALLREHGDRCWVEGCERRVFLDNAHRKPFRSGGGQDFANLLRLCHEHHGQFDAGGWRLLPRRDGIVVMVDRRGVVVGRLRSPSASPPAASPPATAPP